MGRIWNSRERSLWAREGPFHTHQWGGGRGEVRKDGVREHAKRRRCSVVTGEKPTFVPGEGYSLNLAVAQVTRRKG